MPFICVHDYNFYYTEGLHDMKEHLAELNIAENIHLQRPDTKWKPFLLTNILYTVNNTGFVLGKGILPDFY